MKNKILKKIADISDKFRVPSILGGIVLVTGVTTAIATPEYFRRLPGYESQEYTKVKELRTQRYDLVFRRTSYDIAYQTNAPTDEISSRREIEVRKKAYEILDSQVGSIDKQIEQQIYTGANKDPNPNFARSKILRKRESQTSHLLLLVGLLGGCLTLKNELGYLKTTEENSGEKPEEILI